MFRTASFLTVLVVLLSASMTDAQRTRRRQRDAGVSEAERGDQYRDHPRCVEVRAQPVFNGVGWNHVVVVRNGCDRSYDCQVSTDVDPAPTYPVTLGPGEQRSVATRNGSPASGFNPKAVCR